jgi:hypothetical protein
MHMIHEQSVTSLEPMVVFWRPSWQFLPLVSPVEPRIRAHGSLGMIFTKK